MRSLEEHLGRFRSLRVCNLEEADSLGLQGNHLILFLVSGILDGRWAINRGPRELICDHVRIVLVIGERSLNNLILRLSFDIVGLPKL